MNLTHLSIHSKASMLYGSANVKDIIKRVKELGQSAVALTDYSNLFNAIEFYKQAKLAGIKPILGADVLFCEDSEQLRIQKVRQVSHIILLAENDVGWRNITRIVSEANDETNYYYNPRVDFKLLEKYKEGVICLTGGSLDGVVSKHLYDKPTEDGSDTEPAAIFKAEGLVRRFLKVYDKDHFFLEVQSTGISFQEQINTRLRAIALKYGLKTVATGNVHYVHQHDAESHRTLLQMSENSYLKSTHTDFSHEEYYIKSREQFLETGLQEAELDVTNDIANRCHVEIDTSKRRLPKYAFVPSDKTANEYLIELANDGLSRIPKVAGTIDEYQDRLNRELNDIQEMGFSDYFLIVYDVVSWIRSKEILLGRGRGSAGGSLVSYCLGITEIDPLQYGLIWERFLNKGRGGLPDIDTDVPRSKRQKVLEYIRTRFGAGNVAQLVTFNGLQARAVLKEVFRVYNMPFDEANKITALIPAKNDEHVAISLDEAIESVKELKEYSEKYKPWFTIARALEGSYKSTGIHAAAVVISDVPFAESSYPLTRSKDGDPIFGWDMNTVDSLNLLKLDILGLNTLDDIQGTMDLVRERRGIEISRQSIPLDDPVTYAMIGNGFTVGVFQIEKQLGRTWSKNLKPETIDQLSDLVSIIRPGPMECLDGDTKILVRTTPSKRYKTVKQLYNEGLCRAIGDKRYSDRLICVNNDYHFEEGKIKRVVKSGRKNLWRLKVTQRLEGCHSQDDGTQASYLDIVASNDHRFFTHDGWMRLKDIRLGQYVAIMNYRTGRSSRNNKSAAGYKNFRNIAFNHYVYKCVFCDWQDGSLDVNHIDGGRHENNHPDNLCFMCPNHHRVFTEGGISIDDLRIAQQAQCLIHTDDIMFVRYDGKEFVKEAETYDIEVDGQYHNFIAGGFIVHNSKMHESYRDVKMNGSQPAYIHPSLEPILNNTYSALLYQEQVIEICRVLSGMSLIDADKVRKAMGKKKPEEMKKWEQIFTSGCSKNGIDPDIALAIWSYIDKFAGYGFNKSHGVGYALMAYETAYLKANYPTEFLCAKLTNSDGDSEKLSGLVYDAKLFDISVTPPRITHGNKDFAVVTDKHIAFGLTALKGVGVAAVADIVKLSKGLKTFDEIIWKWATTKSKVTSATMLAFIKGGAFDDIQEQRVRGAARLKLLDELTEKERETVRSLMQIETAIPDWVRFVKALADDVRSEEVKDKYGVAIPNVRRREAIRVCLQEYDAGELFDSKSQRIVWEQHFLGISLSGSEADVYKARHKCVDLVKCSSPDMRFEIAVCIDGVREIVTKKGDAMAFVTARDNTYQMDNIVVFPRAFASCKNLLEAGNVIRITGKVDDRGSLIADIVERLK